MPLADIVTVNISVQSAQVTQAGFGVPLILSHTAAWVERVRFYTSLTGVAADFATTLPEYLAAQALFAQSPAPQRIAIGRTSVDVTQRCKIKVKTVASSTVYEFKIGTATASFTSDASATNDEIVTGLATAIENAIIGGAGSNYEVTTAGSVGSKYVVLTSDSPNNWNKQEVVDVNLLSLEQDHADPGIAAALNEILLENSSWYSLVTLFNSRAYILAVAAWAETNEKLYVVASQDTPIINDSTSIASDVAFALKDSAYARTACSYHPSNAVFFDAAWQGKCLPLDPGSETWKFKTLSGVSPTVLTGTHQQNLADKNCNYYYTVGGVNITTEGTVAAGEYIDVVRFRDWLKARMSERIFAKLINAKKIPFTDAGIAVIEAEIRAQLDEGVSVGGLASDPAYTVTVPKASAVSSGDKAARRLTGVSFTGTLAGAIHSLEINGTITV